MLYVVSTDRDIKMRLVSKWVMFGSCASQCSLLGMSRFKSIAIKQGYSEIR